MSKERPPEFDPHPGDPWHPEWASEAEQAGAETTDTPDGAWWRKALRRRTGDGVPDAYAALEESPEPGPLAEAVDVEAQGSSDPTVAEPQELAMQSEPEPELPAAAEIDPAVSVVALSLIHISEPTRLQ
mgnify:CR=1 FL=1